MIVKSGDTHVVQWKANVDLTDATTRLIGRRRGGFDPIMLGHDVTDPEEGIVSHTLTGDLAPGVYRIELEVARNGTTSTYPSDGYATLEIQQDLG